MVLRILKETPKKNQGWSRGEIHVLSPEPPADPIPVGSNGVCSLFALVRNCAHHCSWKIVFEKSGRFCVPPEWGRWDLVLWVARFLTMLPRYVQWHSRWGNTQRASKVGDNTIQVRPPPCPLRHYKNCCLCFRTDFSGDVRAGKDVRDHLTVSPEKGS